MTEARYPCPCCMESELEPRADSHWLHCSSCGREYDPGDMEEYYSRKARRDETLAIRACFKSQENLPRESGGGDDGLAMGPDVPVNEADQCIVSVKTERVGGKNKIIRIKGVRATAREARDALRALLFPELDKA